MTEQDIIAFACSAFVGIIWLTAIVSVFRDRRPPSGDA